jgi:ribosome recycling factor
MKTFFAVFAAILCAAAVLAAVAFFNKQSAKDLATRARAAELSMENLSVCARICIVADKPTQENVARFAEQVVTCRAAAAYLSADDRHKMEEKIKKMTNDVADFIEIKYPSSPELAKPLKSL